MSGATLSSVWASSLDAEAGKLGWGLVLTGSWPRAWCVPQDAFPTPMHSPPLYRTLAGEQNVGSRAAPLTLGLGKGTPPFSPTPSALGIS